jgi:hypothetical protein
LPVIGEQDGDHSEKRQAIDHDRCEAIGDQVVECLDVAGEPADAATRRGAFVITKVQMHEMCEQGNAQVVQHAFTDPTRQVVLRVPGRPSEQACADKQCDGQKQHALVAGGDSAVDTNLGQGGCGKTGGRDQHCQEEGPQDVPSVRARKREQFAQLAHLGILDPLHVVFGVRAAEASATTTGSATHPRSHYTSPNTRSGRASPLS